MRLSGVAGSEAVLMRPRLGWFLGVSGLSLVFSRLSWLCPSPDTEITGSATDVSSLKGPSTICSFTLFLRLFGLNSPPKLPAALLLDFTESLSVSKLPLLGRVNAPLNFSTGEAPRLAGS